MCELGRAEHACRVCTLTFQKSPSERAADVSRWKKGANKFNLQMQADDATEITV